MGEILLRYKTFIYSQKYIPINYLLIAMEQSSNFTESNLVDTTLIK